MVAIDVTPETSAKRTIALVRVRQTGESVTESSHHRSSWTAASQEIARHARYATTIPAASWICRRLRREIHEISENGSIGVAVTRDEATARRQDEVGGSS